MSADEFLARTAETAGATLAAAGLAAAVFRRHATASALGAALACAGAALLAAARPEPSRRALAFALLLGGTALAWGALAAFGRWHRLDRTADLSALDRNPPDA